MLATDSVVRVSEMRQLAKLIALELAPFIIGRSMTSTRPRRRQPDATDDAPDLPDAEGEDAPRTAFRRRAPGR